MDFWQFWWTTVIGPGVLLLVAATGYLWARQRSRQLDRQFGPEPGARPRR